MLEFATAEGKTVADLLTDYSAAYLKEKELEETRMASKAAKDKPEKRRKSSLKPAAENSKEATSSSSAAAKRPQSSKSVMSTEPPEPPPPRPKSLGQPPPPPPKSPAPTSRPVSESVSRPVSGSARPLSQIDAASKIQSRFRGFSLRKEFGLEEAAIIIQCNYRGYRARVMVSNMIEEMLANDDY
jgi:FtsZ-interacting cell division protein ZipA